MTQQEDYATTMVEMMLSANFYTKKKLSEDLGMSRPTLDSRLSGKSEWSKLERDFIEKQFPKMDTIFF